MPTLISPLEELIQAHVYIAKNIKGPGNLKISQINDKYHIGPANNQDSLDITWRNLAKKTSFYLENLRTTNNGFILELVVEPQNKQKKIIEIYIHRKNDTLPKNANYHEIPHVSYNQRWLEFYH